MAFKPQDAKPKDYDVMIEQATGLPEQNFTGQLKFYPNPSSGTFSLEIPTVLYCQTLPLKHLE